MKKYIIPMILSTIAYAQAPLISEIKTEEIELKSQKIELESNNIKYEWVSPILLEYKKSKSDATGVVKKSSSYSLKWSQPIFKSGGIYYSIKHSLAYKKYQDIALELEKRDLLASVLSSVLSLQKIDLEIQKQKLLLENAKIDVLRKKEQYKEGIVDSSFLDNAILVKNSNHMTLISLYTQKKDMLKELYNISDIEYTAIMVPNVDIPTKDSFLENNLVLKSSKANIKQKRYERLKALSNELLNISLDTSYTKDLNSISSDNDTIRYGISASLPIDINSSNRVEIKKLEYLQAKNSNISKKIELSNKYDKIVKTISIIDKKIDVSKLNYRLYKSLVDSSKDKVDSGISTEYDLDILSNSMRIKDIENSIYKIDKKIILVELNKNI
jgi:outer membrane protein TolC